MKLVIFDLDETIVKIDTDVAWSAFLIKHKLIKDVSAFKKEKEKYYQSYLDGKLDINRYLKEFVLVNLKRYPLDTLRQWRAQYLKEMIQPFVLPAAIACIEKHKKKGDYTMLISGTNEFGVEGVCTFFPLDFWVATKLEIEDGFFTGNVIGEPLSGKVKVEWLEEWFKEHPAFSMEETIYYNNSHNDLLFMSTVGCPIAVDPDDKLHAHAEQHHWPIISFR